MATPVQKNEINMRNEELQCDTDSNNENKFAPMKKQGNKEITADKQEEAKYEWKYCTQLVVYITFAHGAGLYGAYLFFSEALWTTRLFTLLLLPMGMLGITAGVHRLWSHRSYKARWPLQIMLAIFFTLVIQRSILYWARDHRVHHKFSETDADPHNSRRGFFFAHIGCLLLQKHPDVRTKGRRVDLSDLLNDKLVTFHDKYINILTLISIFIPTYVPTLWGENIWTAFCLNWFRVLMTLHMSATINSVAHMWGSKPYEKNIAPVENKIASFFAIGEGFHNYHHTFPSDYKAAELGQFSLNVTRYFIEAMAAIGWAYDLRTADKNIIRHRVQRTGDGSHPVWGTFSLI